MYYKTYANRQVAKHLKRPLSKREMFLVPMTADEHAKLTTPPQVSYLLFREGKAVERDLWTIWCRARLCYEVTNKHFPHMLKEVQDTIDWIEVFFFQHTKSGKSIAMTPDESADLAQLLQFTDELQKETNRQHLLTAMQTAHNYCKDKGGNVPL